jgi:drug/metabolite transporter (DMT)-like permease
MNSSAATAGIGLIAASTWGASDFAGGLGARRAPALLIVATGHIFTCICLIAWSLGMHLPAPALHDVVFSAIAGFEGSIALAIFYRALSMGAMGLTAALTGLLTALVPVLYSFFRDGLPSALTLAGLVLGLAAIWFITHTPANGGPATPPRALLYGALAGCGFGAQLILFKIASGSGIVWTMTSGRAAGSVAMVLMLLLTPPKAPWKGFWFIGILAGVLDTAGNFLYIRASQLGRLDVAAVVCSLYPAGTILLAALVLHEWPTRRQLAGMALALAAVALLSA